MRPIVVPALTVRLRPLRAQKSSRWRRPTRPNVTSRSLSELSLRTTKRLETSVSSTTSGGSMAAVDSGMAIAFLVGSQFLGEVALQALEDPLADDEQAESDDERDHHAQQQLVGEWLVRAADPERLVEP